MLAIQYRNRTTTVRKYADDMETATATAKQISEEYSIDVEVINVRTGFTVLTVFADLQSKVETYWIR